MTSDPYAKFKARHDWVTPKHREAIGAVIEAWAFFESALLYDLCMLATRPEPTQHTDLSTALVLATGMKPHTMLGMMRTLVGVLFPKDVEEFDKLRLKIKRLSDTRDIIAHARWIKGERPNSIRTMVIKSVNELKADPHDFTPDELNDVAVRIIGRALDVKVFLQSRGVKLEAPPIAPRVAESDSE